MKKILLISIIFSLNVLAQTTGVPCKMQGEMIICDDGTIIKKPLIEKSNKPKSKYKGGSSVVEENTEDKNSIKSKKVVIESDDI